MLYEEKVLCLMPINWKFRRKLFDSIIDGVVYRQSLTHCGSLSYLRKIIYDIRKCKLISFLKIILVWDIQAETKINQRFSKRGGLIRIRF